MGDEYTLEVRNLTKNYPGVVALDDVSMSFKKGEVHALVGENGAGKSTLMKCISGSIDPSAGTIVYEGETYTHMNPRHAIDMGISTIYQEFCLVNHITVAENIFLGSKKSGKALYSKNLIIESAEKLIKEIDVDVNATDLVAKLTPAHQQMVEILRSVSRQSKVLIMDEPTAALSSNETAILFRVVKRLSGEGVTIIYISHRMEEIFEISDRVTVLRDGRLVKTLETKTTDPDELIRLMVGRDVGSLDEIAAGERGKVLLEVKGLANPGVFEDISFKLHEGEILGFGGLVGAGRTEVMRCIFGADKYAGGEITLDEVSVHPASPQEAIACGIALIPEDRKQQGLIMKLSIGDNISTAIYKKISTALVINERKKRKLAEGYMKSLKIKATGLGQLVSNLSGGNQQKVVLAKMLATNSRIFIFDEPTRGIDVGAKYEIYELMRELTKNGKAVIMVSSDMMELLGISDRIVVMREGRIMGELDRGEFSQEKVLSLASGIVN